MNPSPSGDREERSTFQPGYQSLFDAGNACAFPCDSAGHVNLDALNEHARNNNL